MPNLDRFAHGIKDPQNTAPLTHCAGCGGAIYPGEEIYLVDSDITHNDWECLKKYINPIETTIEDVIPA